MSIISALSQVSRRGRATIIARAFGRKLLCHVPMRELPEAHPRRVSQISALDGDLPPGSRLDRGNCPFRATCMGPVSVACVMPIGACGWKLTGDVGVTGSDQNAASDFKRLRRPGSGGIWPSRRNGPRSLVDVILTNLAARKSAKTPPVMNSQNRQWPGPAMRSHHPCRNVSKGSVAHVLSLVSLSGASVQRAAESPRGRSTTKRPSSRQVLTPYRPSTNNASTQDPHLRFAQMRPRRSKISGVMHEF
jgi:hypothetical protein